jgi:hypothetical protein
MDRKPVSDSDLSALGVPLVGRYDQIKARFDAIRQRFSDLAQTLTDGLALLAFEGSHIQ